MRVLELKQPGHITGWMNGKCITYSNNGIFLNITYLRISIESNIRLTEILYRHYNWTRLHDRI